ncbi:MAG: glycoside hydrolase family 2 TIM barrel-domain containing protein [Chthoniobacteraceae bacterium]
MVPRLLPLFASLAVLATEGLADSPRDTLNFDHAWRFLKADVKGAEAPRFDDAQWRPLDVPHDWSIEGPISGQNPSGPGGGFFPAGIGWYRKHFMIPATDAGKRVSIEFDGVMAHSDVWINGTHLGTRPYGYVSFSYDLTQYLHSGDQPNVLAVRVDDEDQPASRWYAGAGIYRHVRLVLTDPVHFVKDATFITTPTISAREATVHLETSVVNQSTASLPVQLKVSLLDATGASVATAETSPQKTGDGKEQRFAQSLPLPHPALWDESHPQLYRAKVQALSGARVLDEITVPFGVRETHFDAATGFWINGRKVKLKGVCLHQDAGALGVAVPLDGWERRLQLLKGLGVNAIRTSHNPVAPEFLDLCDRMGFFVMDEFFDCWTYAKNPFDYHLDFPQWSARDAGDTVRRDRNHPAIVLYSAGNEIHDTRDTASAKKTLLTLLKIYHENDPTRPVTQALFRPEWHPRLQQRLCRSARRRGPELPRAGTPARPCRSADPQDHRHREYARPPAMAGDARSPGIRRTVSLDRLRLSGRGAQMADHRQFQRPLRPHRPSQSPSLAARKLVEPAAGGAPRPPHRRRRAHPHRPRLRKTAQAQDDPAGAFSGLDPHQPCPPRRARGGV